MPVWVSTDESIDKNKSGERRRHINPDCPTYLAEVPTKDRTAAKGRPNTVKLQEQTVRCEHDKCWLEWEKDQSTKKTTRKSGTTTAKAAAATPAAKVGGKAADLAQKARAARQKPATTAATAAA